MKFLNTLSKLLFKLKWLQANANQKAELMRGSFYHLGRNVELYTSHLGTEPYLISIGDDVIIAASVKFITHDVSCFNMARFLGIEKKYMDKVGCIVLHNNCFIGAYSILLPGTSVGRNSVIAAGSVVRGIIPDNEVWGGNPAKFIMKTEDYANKILRRAKTYPWKYDTHGNIINYSKDELIRMRQDHLFRQERENREANTQNE